jgi:diadenosine tetraphosphatase ApaH/serine/threonine PP2A family protein phosphatase
MPTHSLIRLLVVFREEHYGERSFIYQCRSRFGDDLGYRVWEGCNQVFDRFPLAAVIDQDIFCVHGKCKGRQAVQVDDQICTTGLTHRLFIFHIHTGGIPRPVGVSTTRIQDILAVPRVAGINPPYEHEDDLYQQVASDCIWSDPASEDQEMTTVDPESGFGQSLRGGGAICFGNKAVTDFLKQHELSFIMRAHEAHADGVGIGKGARVFTVFSTSQDHNQGAHAMAGCLLVDNEKIQVINRSPAYKNQYVHRRDSVSVANLTVEELQKRMQLGLVTQSPPADDVADDESESQMEEEWMDLEDNKDNDGQSDRASIADSKGDYVIDPRRRSSIDLSSLSDTYYNEAATMDQSHEVSGGLTEQEPDPKKFRSKRPSVASIQEITEGGNDSSDVDTVDGNEDVELHDA